MEQRQFTPADGSKRTIWELIVHSFHLVGDSRSKTATTPLPETENASDGPETVEIAGRNVCGELLLAVSEARPESREVSARCTVDQGGSEADGIIAV
jgi:hypothetical protein